MKTINDDLQFDYSVYAVIFGADETLLNISLKDGFSFKRLSLMPRKDGLDKVFDTDSLGLRVDYEGARIDNDTLDVICAVKRKRYLRSVIGCDKQFDEESYTDLVSLDNQIRVIRLLNEAPVRFKKIVSRLHSEEYIMVNDVRSEMNIKCSRPIGEAIRTQPFSRFHCSDDEAKEINRGIVDIHFPLHDELLNSCHMYYDLSYHTEKFISITLLTTALEILFLENDHGSKKEMLAKRCACYLYDEPQIIRSTYDKLKDQYKKRSEFVHDGKANGILDEDILFLRECVRMSLLKVMSSTESKKQRITKLQSIVVTHNSLFGE